MQCMLGVGRGDCGACGGTQCSARWEWIETEVPVAGPNAVHAGKEVGLPRESTAGVSSREEKCCYALSKE